MNDDCVKRDRRPEASQLFHALLHGEFMKAHTLSQYAAIKMNVVHNQKATQLAVGSFAIMNSFDFTELHAGHVPQN